MTTTTDYRKPGALASWVDEELVELGWSTDDVKVMNCIERGTA